MSIPNNNKENSYSIAWIDNSVNWVINTVFYYRLIFVFLAIVAIIYVDTRVWYASALDERLKNAILVLTGGSIIIGIFYSIINYEHTHLKSISDTKSSKQTLSFNTAF